jgi:hypothetical protein
MYFFLHLSFQTTVKSCSGVLKNSGALDVAIIDNFRKHPHLLTQATQVEATMAVHVRKWEVTELQGRDFMESLKE